MKLDLKIEFDEEKLRQIVAEVVERLKKEGYLYLDGKSLDCAECTENDFES